MPKLTNTPQAGSESAETATQVTSYKTTRTAIRKARRFALQGLYEWQMSKNPAHEIEAATRAVNAMHTVHLAYYHELLHDTIKQIDEIDELIASAIDRDITKLDGVELAALRIGVYELKNRIEVPFKVVIDEAIQLNAHFGSVDGYKFINAVLDKLAKQLREVEVNALASKQQAKPETKQQSKQQAEQPAEQKAEQEGSQQENPADES